MENHKEEPLLVDIELVRVRLGPGAARDDQEGGDGLAKELVLPDAAPYKIPRPLEY